MRMGTELSRQGASTKARARRSKKHGSDATILVLIRHKTVLLLVLASIGLYLSQKWSSLLLVKDEAVVWTDQSARAASAPADDNEGDRIFDYAPAVRKASPVNNDKDNGIIDHASAVRKTSGNPQNPLSPVKVTVSTLPIHLIQPSTNHSSVMPWRDLASSWDRRATFEGLMELSRDSPMPAVPPSHRLAVILHLSPKMGSLTLRNACRENLRSSCGMEPRGRVDPNGYNDATELGEIVRGCRTTHHFCQRRGTFKETAGRFEGVAFVHMYPFRNYDSWTVSALKQPWDRSGEAGCDHLRGMMEKCADNHGELAFFKYPKTQMSEALPPMVHRVNAMREPHHVVLYPYSELHDVLSALSHAYRIPPLPGSNGTAHVKRPRDGTCDKSILDKFHECFTSNLVELP